MRLRLFWGSFALWTLLLLAVTGRAVIHSEGGGVAKRLRRIETSVNGRKIPIDLWRDGNGPDAFRGLREDWLREGWRPCSEGLDLAAALLGASQDETLITSAARVEAFAKEGRMRTLAVLRTGRGSFAWTAESPQRVAGNVEARRAWSLPLQSPPEASGLLTWETGSWVSSRWVAPEGAAPFPETARAQGFTCRMIPGGTGSWILLKGRTRIVARIDTTRRGREVLLSQFNE